MVRVNLCLGLLLILSGCERAEVRTARRAIQLVQSMGVEIRAEAAQASDRFSRRTDFEELRRVFGSDSFDAGTPLGPDFQGNIALMTLDLERQVEKDPKDVEFLRKAVRRVRLHHQWWIFVRQELETRRDKLAQAPADNPTQRLLGGRIPRADVLAVLTETIEVVSHFEASAQHCLRGIEAMMAQI